MKKLSLIERWKIDIEAYKKMSEKDIEISIPQCEKCKYFIRGDALYCAQYKSEKKPYYVRYANKECNLFCSNHAMKVEMVNEEYRKVCGAVYGFCVGDMLGVPVEFSTRQERELDEVKELRAYGTYHQPFGTWSDDTSLMLCLMDAIANDSLIEKLKDNMIDFYTKGRFTPHDEVFDIGTATSKAIENMIKGLEPTECGGKSQTDNGNGSLMRVLPIAFLYKKFTNDEFIKCIEEVSALTHAHIRAKFSCIFYVKFASQLIMGKEKMEAYNATIDFIDSNCAKKYASEFDNFKFILSKEIIYFDKTQIKSTGYVIDTLEAVLWTFFNATSYKEVVLKAVNLGGDTDTIAAIVGGIAGIYYGFDSIPDNWVQNICRKNEIIELTNLFYNKILKKYDYQT